MAGSWFRPQWFPVSGASACCTANRPQGHVTLDVLLGFFWMPRDSHSPKLEVRPQPAKAAAQRAVAVRGFVRH